MSLNREPYTATGAVQLIAEDASTLVVWTWKGRYSTPIARLTGLLAGEELGTRFERGLLGLKKAAEASAPAGPPQPTTARAEPETAGTPAAEASPEPADAPAVPEPEREPPPAAERAQPAPTTPETVATPTQQ
jgi:hypothetical protein